MRKLLLVCALASLSACGSEQNIVANSVIGFGKGLLTPRVAETPADPRAGLTRAALDVVGSSLLFVKVASINATAALTPVGQNNAWRTWRTVDAVTLTFHSGVLSATRGLGFDLMSTDVSDVVAAVSGSSTEGVRVHTYLDGENQTVTRSFTCQYTHLGVQSVEIIEDIHRVKVVEETCSGSDVTFENKFWYGTDGVMWRSRQWIGPSRGYAEIERLIE